MKLGAMVIGDLTKFLRSSKWSDVQVRAHAVHVLERGDEEELQCYLLQLVQALRFEHPDKSRLSQFLVQQSGLQFVLQILTFSLLFAALSNIEFASFLWWYIAVELHDPAYAKRFYSTYINAGRKYDKLKLGVGTAYSGDGFKLWQSLVRQTEMTAQLCSIRREVRNVKGGTQKKIEKLHRPS